MRFDGGVHQHAAREAELADLVFLQVPERPRRTGEVDNRCDAPPAGEPRACERRLDRRFGGETMQMHSAAGGGTSLAMRSEPASAWRPASRSTSAEPMNPLLPLTMTRSCAAIAA